MPGYRRSDREAPGTRRGAAARSPTVRPVGGPRFERAGEPSPRDDLERRRSPHARWWVSALGMDRPEPEAAESSPAPHLAQLCMDFFSLVLRIRTTGEVPAATLLARKLKEMFDQLDADAADAGISPTDVEEARYALVALIDETILHSKSSVREDWVKQPLQIQYFAENIAGEVFFDHLDKVRKARSATQALEVYYLCLALGFEGRYRLQGTGAELPALLQDVRSEVLPYQRGRALNLPLSPHAERPDAAPALERRVPVFAVVAGAALVLVALLFSLAQLSDHSANDTSTRLKEYTEAQGR